MRSEVNSYNTKMLLANTLKDLLEKKSFSKVTVTEIITLSKVNRNTFYYHFEDIYDLLRWLLEQEAINIVKDYDSKDEIDMAINFTLSYIEKNRSFLKNILFSVGEKDLRRFFSKDFREIIGNFIKIDEEELGIKIDDQYRNVLTMYFTEAIAGLLIESLNKKYEISNAKITSYIKTISTNSIKASLMAYKKI
ncbi:TetR/AcrR family transcriptional regulator C-terminal domain-containing protein [Anaerococcus sp. Marseille-P9784]|uniref:TetR/AcrR family transcriptional regulator C-terminal domain-containing protein n=1 Tax=Anaerococcus sp. Marseille-P9784 TaxID=2614127 RepID=UPI00124A8779|nr:TetR/AcrR family transcriptional regulator C-terminal domain-containing protein [Anaerococcus sp. Marseille-P9784]